MKLVSWNLLHGEQVPPLSTSAQLSHTLSDLIHKASTVLGELGVEVLALQEVDENQDRSGNLHQVRLLAQAIGAEQWAFAPTLIGTPGESWRALTEGDADLHTSASPTPDGEISSYGLGLISKIEVRRWHRLELGRSRVGLPLAIPASGEGQQSGKIRFIYVKDEPRVALAAELANGFTVVVTHLSFVPFVNYYQLRKIRSWLKKLPGEKILVGDFNLGWDLPVRGTQWRSLKTMNTYPSWNPKIQFDYISAYLPTFGERECRPLDIPEMGFSDHLPIGVEIL